jgi:antitoxin (DNA-binding transcriptional repressor) of toxin-antitoxin stability system
VNADGCVSNSLAGAGALTSPMCHVMVAHMKTSTIRELKHSTSTVLGWVATGETVEVRRRNQLVAVLSPPKRAGRIAKPDFVARLRKVYGSAVLPVTGTALVSESRGAR